eukprot:13935540-Ditylum_brightwellii.AAC.1
MYPSGYIFTSGYGGFHEALGSYITSELLDTYDVKNHVIQANKTYGVAKLGPSRNQTVELYRMEVQMYNLSNEFLYKELCIDPSENIMASRQLCWLGMLALTEETRLPRKFIGAWCQSIDK